MMPDRVKQDEGGLEALNEGCSGEELQFIIPNQNFFVVGYR